MRKILFLFALLFAANAHANRFLDKIIDKVSTGVYIAPTYFYTLSGSMENELSNQANPNDNGKYEYSLSGHRYGGQLGFMIGRVVLAYDASFGTFDYEQKNPDGTKFNSELSTFLNSGLLMYRGDYWVVWTGIYFGGSAEDKSRNIKLTDSGGIIFGLGYKIREWLQVNLQYSGYSFTKYTVNGVETVLPTEDRKKFQASNVLLGLSIPLELGGDSNKKK